MPLYSPRTLAVAWEMWHHGQWLVPHINGQPYSHKVPLLFWMIHAGWAVVGVNDVWPRVLEVLIGAAWLLAGTALARRVFQRRPEVAEITPWLLLALSYAFLFGLQIMYEVLLAFWVELALGCSFGLLVAWALPAGFAGGEVYRNQLFFMQTAGRVVDSFDHARPLWWYLPVIPLLLFPWVGWPRLWVAALRWHTPVGDGERILVAWLVPTLLGFSLISGKQVYYLLPLLPGGVMVLARLLSRFQWQRASQPWLGGSPLGQAVNAIGAYLLE